MVSPPVAREAEALWSDGVSGPGWSALFLRPKVCALESDPGHRISSVFSLVDTGLKRSKHNFGFATPPLLDASEQPDSVFQILAT